LIAIIILHLPTVSDLCCCVFLYRALACGISISISAPSSFNIPAAVLGLFSFMLQQISPYPSLIRSTFSPINIHYSTFSHINQDEYCISNNEADQS